MRSLRETVPISSPFLPTTGRPRRPEVSNCSASSGYAVSGVTTGGRVITCSTLVESARLVRRAIASNDMRPTRRPLRRIGTSWTPSDRIRPSARESGASVESVGGFGVINSRAVGQVSGMSERERSEARV